MNLAYPYRFDSRGRTAEVPDAERAREGVNEELHQKQRQGDDTPVREKSVPDHKQGENGK